MKDRIGVTRTVQMLKHFKVSDAVDAVGAEVDVGTARTGMLILSTRGAFSAGNIGIYTSDIATILTKSTAGNSDNLARLVQDTVSSTASVTISSNVISAIAVAEASGIFVFNVDGLSRYVNIQFDPSTSDTAAAPKMITATLIADDMQQAPYAAAASSY